MTNQKTEEMVTIRLPISICEQLARIIEGEAFSEQSFEGVHITVSILDHAIRHGSVEIQPVHIEQPTETREFARDAWDEYETKLRQAIDEELSSR